MASHLIMFDF